MKHTKSLADIGITSIEELVLRTWYLVEGTEKKVLRSLSGFMWDCTVRFYSQRMIGKIDEAKIRWLFPWRPAE